MPAETDASTGTTGSTDATDATGTTGTSTDTAVAGAEITGELFDASAVHSISISVDEAAYDAMIDAFVSEDAKEWIEATVTIDGVTYTQVGLRLKGNSTLRALVGESGGRGGVSTVSADDPATLPRLIDLDHFVDGQTHLGVTEFVVRANTSATAMNEAVALALLDEAGLAAVDAVAVRFSVNGGSEVLRLVVENPDDEFMADELGSGALYKAESSGDYSYRGDDPEAYTDAFDQEAGKDTTDLTPLIEFLDFLNNSDDATFAAELADRLDVDAFATYLAMQEIVDNFDDIDGPGNNSYLYWDAETGRFTVVPWDYNLAFGVTNFGGGGGGGGGGGCGGGGGAGGGGAGGRGGPTNQSNVLVERFMAVEEFSQLYEDRLEELTASLIDSGRADEILAGWVELLDAQASDLVTAETVETEAATIAATWRT